MMASAFPWTATARRLLAAHLERLRDFFGGLGRGLRERLVLAAGEAVAAVLRSLLDDGPPSPFHGEHEMTSWRDEVEAASPDEPPEVYPVEPEETPACPPSTWRPTLAAA